MSWLNSNPIDYSGKSYHKTWSEMFPGNKSEIIVADSVDSHIAEIIQSTFEKHLGEYLEKDLSELDNSIETLVLRGSMAQSAFDCSNELRQKLPFLGFSNCYDFLDNKERVAKEMRAVYPDTTLGDDKLVWTYYLRHVEKENRLSELTKSGFLDCVGHALAIKLSLEDKYGLNGFALYNQRPKERHINPDGTVTTPVMAHAMAALKIGKEYFLRIDPVHDRGGNHLTFLNYYRGFYESFTDSDIRQNN